MARLELFKLRLIQLIAVTGDSQIKQLHTRLQVSSATQTQVFCMFVFFFFYCAGSRNSQVKLSWSSQVFEKQLL